MPRIGPYLPEGKNHFLMGSKRKSAPSTTSLPGKSTTSMPAPRKRSALRESKQASTASEDVIIPKVINAADMYGLEDERPASSKIMALFGRIFIETIPQCLAVGVMLGLIFGGCCSNVSDDTSCIASAGDHEVLQSCLGVRARGHRQVSQSKSWREHVC